MRSLAPSFFPLVVLGALLGALLGSAPLAQAGRNNYYAYTDANGTLHVTNVPGRTQGDWSLYKSLEGSGGDDVARGRAAAGEARVPVRSDSERLHRYDSFIRAAAGRYQLPESLLRAVIHTESNFYAQAVSRAGAVGLMQLMPKTAKALGVRDPYDPSQSIHGGARYLRLLANRYDGDMVLVLAAYNAGAGNVERYGGVPPFAETRAYVRSVLRRYYAYERQEQLGVDEERPGPARHIAR
ncbi:lytic transglycosylase domain-containing protein [Paraliomyxa miuraensis]|uniref:lytic transglycosylase domain-containing protein n=1 Tax=Paraliomyxa miuraensis TaxID=376150 RepID=UPI0022545D10|nr:lytic transglycosylase domain-containing protein [Paraliomyxa miuraensis]MCX4245510.1 lytic transglycosylase domain-containing protein [Paraliomyxa miuraensis]